MTRLYRSESNKKIAGICGGIGEVLGVDPTMVRLLSVFLLFTPATFAVIFTYFIAWWIIPVGKPGESR